MGGNSLRGSAAPGLPGVSADEDTISSFFRGLATGALIAAAGVAVAAAGGLDRAWAAWSLGCLPLSLLYCFAIAALASWFRSYSFDRGAGAHERARAARSADVGVGGVPVLAAQFSLEDLAGAGRGQRVGEGDAARQLVTGEVPPAELLQFLAGSVLAGLPDDDGVHPFAPAGVRDADDSAGCHGRVLGQGVLDFGGVHVLTAGDDHVLKPVDDE